MHNTQIVEIDIADLIPADWNYKSEGTEEQVTKLAASIQHDASAGVPAVRELNGKFEIIDGNHRLQALQKLGWNKTPCENFGEISKATAITIARRRNYQWFEDDVIQYAELLGDEVLKEYTMEALEIFMPDSREEMENLSKLLDFDWKQFQTKNTTGEEYEEEVRTIKITVTEAVYHQWREWKERCESKLGYESDARCLEFAIVEALNIPEEALCT